jgi:hypothetical protein
MQALFEANTVHPGPPTQTIDIVPQAQHTRVSDGPTQMEQEVRPCRLYSLSGRASARSSLGSGSPPPGPSGPPESRPHDVARVIHHSGKGHGLTALSRIEHGAPWERHRRSWKASDVLHA